MDALIIAAARVSFVCVINVTLMVLCSFPRLRLPSGLEAHSPPALPASSFFAALNARRLELISRGRHRARQPLT